MLNDLKETIYKNKRKKKEKIKRERNIGIKNKMTINKYLSVITLNVNGLNAPNKRHRVDEWIRKHDSHICCLQETHLRIKTHTD